MTSHLTAAEYQQLTGPGRAGKPPAKRTKCPRPTSAPSEPGSAPISEKIKSVETTALPPPTFGELPGPCSWLIGGQSLALAGSHFPERHRAVLTGPADEGLLKALLEAITSYYSKT